MSPPNPLLPPLLTRALVSLPAWHLLEAMAAGPAQGLPLRTLLTITGLELGEARRAIGALGRLGLLRLTGRGLVALAPRHADELVRLIGWVNADRGLWLTVVKQAARRDCTAGPLEKTIARLDSSAPTPRP